MPKLIGEIKQNNGDFALLDANNLRGNVHCVKTVDEMNSLIEDKRKLGMLCYVEEEGKHYCLSTEGWKEMATDLKLEEDIQISEGPLASLLNKAGYTKLSKGTSITDIITQWVLKTTWSSPVFKEATLTAFQTIKGGTLNKTGLVKVGDTITTAACNPNASTSSSTARTYTGITYGYSSGNNNTVENKGTSITANVTDIKSAGQNYTLKRTVNKESSVSAATSATNTLVTLPAYSFKAVEGTNTVAITATGTAFTGNVAAIDKYYACSNTGTTSEDHVISSRDAVTLTSNIPSATVSYTVTGVYPIYATTSAIAECTEQDLTTSSVLSLTMPAETADNKHCVMIVASKSISKVELYDTSSQKYSTYDLSKFDVTYKNVDVCGVATSYKVYTRNDLINGESSFKFHIS